MDDSKELEKERPVVKPTAPFDEQDKTLVRLVGSDEPHSDFGEPRVKALDESSKGMVGQTLSGNILIRELIGSGGMSAVYKGWHSQIDRVVAVKVMDSDLLAEENALLRFEQEAQAVGKLDHSGIVKVHDFRVGEQGSSYLVMDYIDGTPLDTELARTGPFEPEQAIEIFKQACDALQHAHHQRVIHRDLKPSNLMLTVSDSGEHRVKLLDFGIAKILPHEGDRRQRLTQTGAVFGSPYYMSPEQCLGQNVDSRSDIYSMGCLIFEVLTGQVPLKGENALQTFFKHTTESPPSTAEINPDLLMSRDFDAVIFKAMAKNPEDRYQSMTELKRDLEAIERRLQAGATEAEVAQNELVRRQKKAMGTEKEKRNFGIKEIVISGVLLASIGAGMVMMNFGQVSQSNKDWSQLNIEGQEKFDRGEYKEARSLFDRALQLSELEKNKQKVVLEELIDLNRARGMEADLAHMTRLQELVSSRDQELREEMETLLLQASTLAASQKEKIASLGGEINDRSNLLSNSRAETRKFAAEKLEKLASILDENGLIDSLAYARTLHNKAYWFYQNQQVPLALAGFTKAAGVSEKLLQSDPSMLDYRLKNLEWIARSYVCLGQNEKALETLEQRKADSRKAKDLDERKLRTAETELEIAEVYTRMFEQGTTKQSKTESESQALLNVKQSIRTLESLHGERVEKVLADAHALQGILLLNKGDFVGAKSSLSAALKGLEKIPDYSSHYRVLTLAGLGDVLANEGDLSGAEPLYRRSLAEGLRFMPEMTSKLDEVLGKLEQLQVRMHQSRQHETDKSKRGKTEEPIIRDESKILENQIPIVRLRLAIDKNKHGANSYQVVRDLRDLSSLERRSGNLKDADELLEQALKVTRDTGDKWSSLVLILDRSKLRYDSRDPEGSNKLVSEALDIGEADSIGLSRHRAAFDRLSFEIKTKSQESAVQKANGTSVDPLVLANLRRFITLQEKLGMKGDLVAFKSLEDKLSGR